MHWLHGHSHLTGVSRWLSWLLCWLNKLLGSLVGLVIWVCRLGLLHQLDLLIHDLSLLLAHEAKDANHTNNEGDDDKNGNCNVDALSLDLLDSWATSDKLALESNNIGAR